MQGRHNSSEILRLGQEPQRHDPEAGGGVIDGAMIAGFSYSLGDA
jgi:hypothetical protein